MVYVRSEWDWCGSCMGEGTVATYHGDGLYSSVECTECSGDGKVLTELKQLAI